MNAFISRINIIDIITFLVYLTVLYTCNDFGNITLQGVFCILVFIHCIINQNNNRVGTVVIIFSLLYLLFSYINGHLTSFSGIFTYIIILYFFYVFGLYVVRKTSNKRLLIDFILISFFTYPLVIYYDVVTNIINTGEMMGVVRNLSIHGNEDLTQSATRLGLIIEISMIGLPLFFTLKDYTVERCLFLIMTILAVLSTVFLLNRTGLLVCFISTLCVLFYYFRKQRYQLLGIGFILIAAFLILQHVGIINTNVIDAYAARNEHDLASGGDRFWRWSSAIPNLILHPFGWKDNIAYIHNMWLDIAKVSGVIPFILLVWITVRSFKTLYRILKFGDREIASMFLALNICFFLSCFVEPVYGGLHLALYLMVIGMQEQYYDSEICETILV